MAPVSSAKGIKNSNFLYTGVESDKSTSSSNSSPSPSTYPTKSQCSSVSDGESFEGLGEIKTVRNKTNMRVSNDYKKVNYSAGVELELAPHANSTTNNVYGSNISPRDNCLRRTRSQLHRSSSFNSSDRSSNCDTEDMYSDVSLENVQVLNYKLELLQRQLTDLADTQNIAEDRTSRTKTEYAVLKARYHMLEEQYRDSELRAEERLAEEQKRHRELFARVEREASLQSENYHIKIRTIEIELNTLRESEQRLRTLCDKQANDLHHTEEKLEEAHDQILTLQQDVDEAQLLQSKHEEEKKVAEEVMVQLSKELDRLRSATKPAMTVTSPEATRLEELNQELEELRIKNRVLEEQNEELQAAVLTHGLEEGRHLLNGTLNSLAQELEEMSQAQDSVDSATLTSLNQLQQTAQEKEDENIRLKHYIDTILLNIVENYPQLLEVKPMQ